jgi:hypothetical protein
LFRSIAADAAWSRAVVDDATLCRGRRDSDLDAEQGEEVHVLCAGADVLRVRARQLRLEVVHSLRSCATVDAAASATPAAAARSARWWLPSPPRKSSAARRGEWRRWRA